MKQPRVRKHHEISTHQLEDLRGHLLQYYIKSKAIRSIFESYFKEDRPPTNEEVEEVRMLKVDKKLECDSVMYILEKIFIVDESK